MSLRLIFSLLVCAILADPSFAQLNRRLVRLSSYRQAGLERAWSAQVELDRARSRVTGLKLQVVGMDSYDDFMATSHPVSEVTFKSGVRRFSSIDLGPNGGVLGAAEAHRLAEKEMIRLTARGYEPKLTSVRVPAMVLYVQSSNGTLHAIDAENGRTVWAIGVGRPDHPTLTPAANDKYVAVVNGSSLYLLDRLTGERIWKRDVQNNPTIGPTLSPDMVFVPTMSGQLEGHWLPRESTQGTTIEVSTPRPIWYFQSDKEVTGSVTVTLNTASWPTRSGRVYVADLTEPEVIYRFQTSGPIYGRTIYVPPDRLGFTSTDGYLYVIDQRSGDLLWEYSAGEFIHQPPVSFGDQIYLITVYGNLHCLALADAEKKWHATGIRQILAAGRDHLYVVDHLGRTLALNPQTGGRMAAVSMHGFDSAVVNTQTDRIFLADQDGTIVCLRETQSELPTIHQPLPQPPTEGEAAARPSPAVQDEFQPPAESPDEADPFAPVDDASDDDPFAPADDADDDPFAPADDASDDPFAPIDQGGADDDPFAPIDMDEDPF